MKRRDVLKALSTTALALQAAPKSTFAIEGDRFVLNGKPWVIRAGEMHYARVPRLYWRDRMQKMRAMGLNTLCMYSFWNMHEPRPGEFDFSGNLDIGAYIRTAQEEGLWVIVRPGPYSCAEWEFGGYPAWLFKDPEIKVRTKDPRFLEPAGRYIRRLMAEVAPWQITRGGPVILCQVENEYGSFGKDKEYLSAIRKMIADSHIDVTLYTSDGSLDYMLSGGTLPDLPSVINFGGAPQKEFANFAKFRTGVPLMCGEYWVGWFDHWGEQHHTGDNAVHLAGIDWMLQRNISFNLYMVHGGTSFGPMSGANFDKVYQPDITSYDYDSPIDEAGRPAPKFALYRDAIKKHLLPGEVIPELPAPLPIIEIPRFEFQTAAAPLLPLMAPTVRHEQPQSFETIGLDYGFVLYRTRVETSVRGTLKIEGLHDYALVLEGTRVAGRLDRRLNQESLEIALQPGAVLQILVENMGRINFGPKLMEDRKGILGQVTLDGKLLSGWEMCSFRVDRLPRLSFGAAAPAPAFHRATFQVPRLGDTYIDMRGWGKGYAWVNGFCLGRYWKIGPQQTLFCPRPFLKRGANELVVLDLEDSGARTSQGLKDPVWATISA